MSSYDRTHLGSQQVPATLLLDMADTRGAVTYWHLVPDGFGQLLRVTSGRCWVVVAKPPADEANSLDAWIARFLGHGFQPRQDMSLTPGLFQEGYVMETGAVM